MFLVAERFCKFSSNEHIKSVSEFRVHKKSTRHTELQRRALSLSDTCLIKRDPKTYNNYTLRPLFDIFALVEITIIHNYLLYNTKMGKCAVKRRQIKIL